MPAPEVDAPLELLEVGGSSVRVRLVPAPEVDAPLELLEVGGSSVRVINRGLDMPSATSIPPFQIE